MAERHWVPLPPSPTHPNPPYPHPAPPHHSPCSLTPPHPPRGTQGPDSYSGIHIIMRLLETFDPWGDGPAWQSVIGCPPVPHVYRVMDSNWGSHAYKISYGRPSPIRTNPFHKPQHRPRTPNISLEETKPLSNTWHRTEGVPRSIETALLYCKNKGLVNSNWIVKGPAFSNVFFDELLNTHDFGSCYCDLACHD